MKRRDATKYMFVVFVLILLIRLLIAFSSSEVTYDSYYHLRKAQEIAEHGIPQWHDTLSYGGRELIYLPGFHYILALLSFLLPIQVAAKLLSNIALSCLVPITYLISSRITKPQSAFFTALATAILPITFLPSDISVESLFLPLAFIAIYAFMRIKEKRYLYIYLTVIFILSFTSSATIILIIGFLAYMLLSTIEGKKISRAQGEVIIFSLLFYVWTQMIFFKKLLQQQGISFFWQNTPPQILQQYFPSFSSIDLLLIGIIPLITGLYVVYKAITSLKDNKAFLIISMVITSIALVWGRMLSYDIALSFIGICFAILFALFYEEIHVFIKQTKVAIWHTLIPIFVVLVLVGSTGYTLYDQVQSQQTPQDLDVFTWLAQQGNSNSITLATLQEGHLITHYAKHQNVMDSKFVLIDNSEMIYKDLTTMLTTPFQTKAVELFDKYDVEYVVITSETNKLYEEEFPSYTRECFKKIYDKQSQIYQITCTLQDEQDTNK